MRIHHPFLIKALGFLGAGVLRLWVGTLRYRCRALGQNLLPDQPGLDGRYIYALWHENILLPACLYARPDVHVLSSQHGDGQISAEIQRHLGFRIVFGSSSHGGVQALRQLIRLSEISHLAITPDGPRGPRRQVKPGLIYLASRTGLPIVPLGIGYDRPWRLRSWDRLAMPRPGSVVRVVVAPPIRVPPNAERHELAAYLAIVEDALSCVSQAAEQWAETGTWPTPTPPPSQILAARLSIEQYPTRTPGLHRHKAIADTP